MARPTATPTNGTATVTFADLYSVNTHRSTLQIQNQGAQILYVFFGSGTATAAESIQIAAGGFYEPFVPSTEKVQIACDAATCAFVAVEG